MDNNCSLTSNFTGSYELLSFIVEKYKIYNSDPSKLIVKYHYDKKQLRKKCHSSWDYHGVPSRVWNLLYKDLTILKLLGYINFNNFEELRNEYERTIT